MHCVNSQNPRRSPECHGKGQAGESQRKSCRFFPRLVVSYLPSRLHQFVAERINPLCSPVCETTGYLINTDFLTGTSRTPTATLKDPSQGAELYDVLGGTKLKQLIQALEKDGRALMNLGGFTGLPHFALFRDLAFANLLYRPEYNWCHGNGDSR